MELCRPRPGRPGTGGCQESTKVPGRKLASPATASCMQEVEGCVAGHQEVQRPPGYWGQGLQNPAVSGAGVPRNSPGFYRREWTSQETVAFRSRKRARLRSLWEGAELCDSSLSPASSHWPPCWAAWSLGAWVESQPSPGPRGGPNHAITIQHLGTQRGAKRRKQRSF